MTNKIIRREGYAFSLVNIDCLPNSDHFNVVMQLDEPIEEYLPYLAACLPGCTYVHGTGVVNLMDAGHIVAIYPTRITITDVRELQEAETLCRHYMQKIAEVNAARGSITPVYQKRLSLTVLEIYRSLPQTNCGLCHSPSCMAFAAKVFRRDDTIGSCVPVARDPEKHRELLHQLQTSGYDSL